MAEKKAAKAKEFQNTPDREGEQTYQAVLAIGNEQVARITLRATDDEDAKEQLERSKPPYFEGMGKWTLTKSETKTIEV